MAVTAIRPNGAAKRQRSGAVYELIRFPNLFTAVADTLAGYALAHALLGRDAGEFGFTALFSAMAISAMLYAAGATLNDVADFHRDKIFRPERPLAREALSVDFALRLALVLIFAAFFTALLLGAETAVAVFLLIIFIMAYNFLFKDWPILGPVSMGLCRAANMFTGMAAAGTGFALIASYNAVRMPLVLLFGYVMVLTSISLFENREKVTLALILDRVVILIALCAMIVVYAFSFNRNTVNAEVVAAGFTALAVIAQIVYRTIGLRKAGHSKRAIVLLVLAGVRSLPLFDAALLFGVGATTAGCFALALFIPAYVLSGRLGRS